MILVFALGLSCAQPAEPVPSYTGTWAGSVPAYPADTLILEQHGDTLIGRLRIIGDIDFGGILGVLPGYGAGVYGFVGPGDSLTVVGIPAPSTGLPRVTVNALRRRLPVVGWILSTTLSGGVPTFSVSLRRIS